MNNKKILNKDKKILNVAVITITAGFILFALFAMLNLNNVTENNDKINALQISKNIAQEIKNDVELKINTLESFASNVTPDYFNNSNPQKFNYLFEQQDIAQVFFINEKQVLFSDTVVKQNNDSVTYSISLHYKAFDQINSANEKTDISEFITITNYHDLKKNKTIIISEPFVSKITGKEKISIKIYKAIFKNSIFIGVVGIEFLLDNIEQLINITGVSEKENYRILSTDQKNIVSATNKSWLAGQNVNILSATEKNIIIKTDNKNPVDIIDKYNVVLQEITFSKTTKNWYFYNAIPVNFASRPIINHTHNMIWGILAILLTAIFIIRYFVLKNIKTIETIKTYTQKLSKGETLPIEKEEQTDTLSEILNSLSDISENKYKFLNVLRKVNEDNFKINASPEGKEDLISPLFNKIIKKLDDSKHEIQKNVEESKIELWTRQGREEVYNAQRESNNNLELLAHNITRRIVNYSDAIFGAMFFNNIQTSGFIEMIASYAYSNEKHIEKKFIAGEGLIGACVLSKKSIELNNVPDKYTKITSGLGSGKPSYLLILPIIWQNEVLAVLELGYMHRPEDYKMKFVYESTQNISSWLNTAQISQKTEILLETSQHQTDSLHEKETELNNKITELQKVQEQYADRTAEMESMINAVNNTVMSVEYTTDGIFIRANEAYSQIMGYEMNDLQGLSVFDIVQEKHLEELKQNIEDVKKGKLLRKKLVRITKSGEEKQLFATYTPYYDKTGKISRIIFFALDISDFTANK